jgi:hypothetical protein
MSGLQLNAPHSPPPRLGLALRGVVGRLLEGLPGPPGPPEFAEPRRADTGLRGLDGRKSSDTTCSLNFPSFVLDGRRAKSTSVACESCRWFRLLRNSLKSGPAFDVLRTLRWPWYFAAISDAKLSKPSPWGALFVCASAGSWSVGIAFFALPYLGWSSE